MSKRERLIRIRKRYISEGGFRWLTLLPVSSKSLKPVKTHYLWTVDITLMVARRPKTATEREPARFLDLIKPHLWYPNNVYGMKLLYTFPIIELSYLNLFQNGSGSRQPCCLHHISASFCNQFNCSINNRILSHWNSSWNQYFET